MRNQPLGLDGLCSAYTACLDRIQLYGPTYFNEVLSTAAAKSTSLCSQRAQSYNILLIITDGVINDMQRTVDCIVEATRLPLSIIIVGVGDADFTNMEILDADDEPLRHSRSGKCMERDIVQFVPFNASLSDEPFRCADCECAVEFGSVYASKSFYDVKHDRQLLWQWILEERDVDNIRWDIK